MSVRPGTSDVDVRLDPVALGRPFDDVQFTVTSSLGQGRAGRQIVHRQRRRPQAANPRVRANPGGPGLYPLTCEKASCITADYGSFTQLPGPKVAFGEPIPVKVARSDDGSASWRRTSSWGPPPTPALSRRLVHRVRGGPRVVGHPDR
jgi:hypothetical protein